MKLGDVLRKERERAELSVEKVAESLGVSLQEYKRMEGGDSPIEEWGPTLARLAIKLQTPTSRLIAETGRVAQSRQRAGQCGALIAARRIDSNLGLAELAARIDVPEAEMSRIESGESPLETYAPLLLGFAEMIDQPIFNLFYPCGLPFQELDDYP